MATHELFSLIQHDDLTATLAQLLLAATAIETGALSLFDLLDWRTATAAGFACSAVDPIRLLEVAGLA